MPSSSMRRAMDLEKNPLSSRTAIRRTPAPLRRATSPASHASAPRAVCAPPGRQRTPRRSPVSRT